MAPEVFQEKYCMKADIWSVGCVAFQMVVGTPPWKNQGFSNPISLFQHLQKAKDPPPMTVPNENVILQSKDGKQKLDSLKKCIVRCFARNPVDRPNAHEMMSDNFFSNEALWNDADQSDSLSLFSLSPPLCKRSLVQHIANDSSPIQAHVGFLATPFLSPLIPQPMPLVYSPSLDTSGWPTWARNRQKQSNCESHFVDANKTSEAEMMGSLAFSEDSKPNDNARSEVSFPVDHLKVPSQIDEESQDRSQPTLNNSPIGTRFAEEKLLDDDNDCHK
jgi:serine/threonine protein kinase